MLDLSSESVVEGWATRLHFAAAFATTRALTTAVAAGRSSTAALTGQPGEFVFGCETVTIRIGAGDHALHPFGEFVFGEFSVTVLVECHQSFDHFGRIGTPAALFAAATTKSATALRLATLASAHITAASTTTGTTSASGRAFRANFIFGEFSVAVLVEGLECGGGVLQFFAGNFAILVGVQGDEDREKSHHAGSAATTLPTGATTALLTAATTKAATFASGRSALATASLSPVVAAFPVLGQRIAHGNGCAERQYAEECFVHLRLLGAELAVRQSRIGT